MTEHVTARFARRNLTTHGSVISNPVSVSPTRTTTDETPDDMGNPLLDSVNQQNETGMLLGSDSPLPKYDPSQDFNFTVTNTSINRVDTTLVEELSADLGALATIDEFYNSETGLAEFLGSPEPRVVKAPYKEGPKIGHTSIDQLRSMSTLLDTHMDMETDRLSSLDPPSSRDPGSAPVSPKGPPPKTSLLPTLFRKHQPNPWEYNSPWGRPLVSF